ncbi:MAG: hypothetical protein KDI88_08310 [Gammaproteobacteria bacterium]|nr:hypothetical protein [Gammaproteobacteria bacterium]
MPGFGATSARGLTGLFAAVVLWSLVLVGCTTSPPPTTDGRRVGVLSLLGDRLQVVDTGVGEKVLSHSFVDAAGWRIDDHVEQFARQAIQRGGRSEVVGIDIDREVAQRIYAACDSRCGSRAPEVRIEALGKSLSRWRQDTGLERLVVFVRSDNRHAVMGPLATSAAGVGLGIVSAPRAAGRPATVFTYVAVIVVEAETVRVLAKSGFFNTGFVDAAVPALNGGNWPPGGGGEFEQAIRRQLEDGVNAVFGQLGLLGPATDSALTR